MRRLSDPRTNTSSLSPWPSSLAQVRHSLSSPLNPTCRRDLWGRGGRNNAATVYILFFRRPTSYPGGPRTIRQERRAKWERRVTKLEAGWVFAHAEVRAEGERFPAAMGGP
jgi:hypothetical protein